MKIVQPVITIIIPTYLAEPFIPKLHKAFSTQTVCPSQVLIVDSSSPDQTIALARSYCWRVVRINKEMFDHAKTRNYGAQLAEHSDIFVFMTQDALPANEYWLEKLIEPICTGEAAATFARQIPKPGADPLEVYARHFNYPAQSQLKTIASAKHMGIKAFSSSNVSSAINARVFWQAGKFPEPTISNEDMIMTARLLHSGYSIKYVAEAIVYHSHSYSIKQQFGRNFDIGVSIARAGRLLEDVTANSIGMRFVRGQLKYVLQNRRWDLAFRVLVESAAKFVAFQLGLREQLLPIWFKRSLSMHKSFWSPPGSS